MANFAVFFVRIYRYASVVSNVLYVFLSVLYVYLYGFAGKMQQGVSVIVIVALNTVLCVVCPVPDSPEGVLCGGNYFAFR